MTEPTPAPFVNGPPAANAQGVPVSVRRSAIHSLEVNTYGVPPIYDIEGNPLTGWIERFGVMARASTDVRVRVADFADQADAAAYAAADPDHYLG